LRLAGALRFLAGAFFFLAAALRFLAGAFFFLAAAARFLAGALRFFAAVFFLAGAARLAAVLRLATVFLAAFFLAGRFFAAHLALGIKNLLSFPLLQFSTWLVRLDYPVEIQFNIHRLIFSNPDSAQI
jgi:hypothetical protein